MSVKIVQCNKTGFEGEMQVEVLPSEEKTLKIWMSRVHKFSGAETKISDQRKKGINWQSGGKVSEKRMNNTNDRSQKV